MVTNPMADKNDKFSIINCFCVPIQAPSNQSKNSFCHCHIPMHQWGLPLLSLPLLSTSLAIFIAFAIVIIPLWYLSWSSLSMLPIFHKFLSLSASPCVAPIAVWYPRKIQAMNNSREFYAIIWKRWIIAYCGLWTW